MIKSQSIKVLLGVLVLSCAPAAAQVSLGLNGPQALGSSSFVVVQGDSIEVRGVANPGDSVGVFAVPMDKTGQPDYAAAVVLLLEVKSESGAVAGQFDVPAGTGDSSVLLVAAALDARGGLSLDMATLYIRAN